MNKSVTSQGYRFKKHKGVLKVAKEDWQGFSTVLEFTEDDLKMMLTRLQHNPGGSWPRRIKKLRKRLGFTQKEFARVMQVSFATVNRWERGHCKPLRDRMARLREIETWRK